MFLKWFVLIQKHIVARKILIKHSYTVFSIAFFQFYFSDKNALYHPKEFLEANRFPVNEYVKNRNFSAWEWLLTDKPHYFGLIPGWAYPTGVVILVILFIMYICSMKWVRKGGYFEVNNIIHSNNVNLYLDR